MYWKFKLPLILILVAILGAIIYSGVSYYRNKSSEQEEAQKQEDIAQATSLPTASQPSAPLVRSETTPMATAKPFAVKEITEESQAQQPQPNAEILDFVGATGKEVVAELPKPPKTQEPDLKPLAQPDASAQPQMPAQDTAAKLPPIQQAPAPQTPPVTQQKQPDAQPAAVQAPAKPQPPAPQVVKATPVQTPDAQNLLQAATDRFQQKQYLQARQIAQKALAAPGVREYDPTWRQAAKLISEVNRIFTFTKTTCPEKTSYTIKEGDMLVRIAHRQKVSLLILYAMNPGIKPRTLWVGRKLTYLDGDWSIKVSKSNFILTLYRNGEIYRVYPVGIGRDDRTPVGTFQIRDKVMNPAWDSPTGRILPGDPRNILGTRWMGLLATGSTSPQLVGYGIHGTTLPDTVGTPSSAGCVRLKNQDVEDLYTYIPEPSSAVVPVTIID